MKMLLKTIIAPLLLISCMILPLQGLANNWRPHHRTVRRERHHVRRMNRHIRRQERRANRDLRRGDYWGYFRHEQHAKNIRSHKRHVRNKIHRQRWRWGD